MVQPIPVKREFRTKAGALVTIHFDRNQLDSAERKVIANICGDLNESGLFDDSKYKEDKEE